MTQCNSASVDDCSAAARQQQMMRARSFQCHFDGKSLCARNNNKVKFVFKLRIKSIHSNAVWFIVGIYIYLNINAQRLNTCAERPVPRLAWYLKLRLRDDTFCIATHSQTNKWSTRTTVRRFHSTGAPLIVFFFLFFFHMFVGGDAWRRQLCDMCEFLRVIWSLHQTTLDSCKPQRKCKWVESLEMPHAKHLVVDICVKVSVKCASRQLGVGNNV